MTESSTFRAVLGLIAVIGSLIAFGGLFLIEIPARNENALMFAMGIIFGWGSAVFASEYGSSNIGRKVADSAVRQLENQTAGAPQDVKEAADQVADAADREAGRIKARPDAAALAEQAKREHAVGKRK